MKAVILSGGLGTRLRPFTLSLPKGLLPLANRPFLEYQLLLLKKYRIDEVLIALSYMPEAIKNYFGEEKYGIKIYYTVEKGPLGTGGAVKKAEDFIDQTTFILNGDVLSDIALSSLFKLHHKRRANITISLIRVKDPTQYGLVERNGFGRIRSFLEKPQEEEIITNTVNAGIYLFEPEVLKFIPEGVNYSLERDLFPTVLRNRGRLFSYIHTGYWQDVGTLERYLQANFDLLEGRAPFKIKGIKEKRGSRYICGKGSFLKGVKIRGNIILGEGVVIGKGASLANSVILDRAKIGDYSKIEGSVIGRDVVVKRYSQIYRMGIPDNSMVQDYTRTIRRLDEDRLGK